MNIRIFNNNVNVDFIEPLQPLFEYYILTIDPSKTNMAIIVASPAGDLESIIEISGNNWGNYSKKADDDTYFCEQVREFLDMYLKDLNIIEIYVEKAITKKGMMHHHSNMTLTEIRAMILSWGLARLGKKPVEVPNVSWKHGVFPEGMNRQSEKMSKWYLVDYLGISEFAEYYEYDVTDAYCMLLYVKSKYHSNYVVKPFRDEKADNIKYTLKPWSGELPTLQINSKLSLSSNVSFYMNRNIKGTFLFDIENLTFDEIYGYATGFPLDYCQKIRMVEV